VRRPSAGRPGPLHFTKLRIAGCDADRVKIDVPIASLVPILRRDQHTRTGSNR
jgi:hypothetical protein